MPLPLPAEKGRVRFEYPGCTIDIPRDLGRRLALFEVGKPPRQELQLTPYGKRDAFLAVHQVVIKLICGVAVLQAQRFLQPAKRGASDKSQF